MKKINSFDDIINNRLSVAIALGKKGDYKKALEDTVELLTHKDIEYEMMKISSALGKAFVRLETGNVIAFVMGQVQDNAYDNSITISLNKYKRLLSAAMPPKVWRERFYF